METKSTFEQLGAALDPMSTLEDLGSALARLNTERTVEARAEVDRALARANAVSPKSTRVDVFKEIVEDLAYDYAEEGVFVASSVYEDFGLYGSIGSLSTKYNDVKERFRRDWSHESPMEIERALKALAYETLKLMVEVKFQ
jgi:hypothetical protein